MEIGGELAAAGQLAQGRLLPDAVIAINQINHGGLKHEVAAIDPATIAIGLLLEVVHLVPIQPEGAVAARRLHRGEGGLAS